MTMFQLAFEKTVVANFWYGIRSMDGNCPIFLGMLRSLSTARICSLRALPAPKKMPESSRDLGPGVDYLSLPTSGRRHRLGLWRADRAANFSTGDLIPKLPTRRPGAAIVCAGLLMFSMNKHFGGARCALSDIKYTDEDQCAVSRFESDLCRLAGAAIPGAGLAIATPSAPRFNLALLTYSLRRKLSRLGWGGQEDVAGSDPTPFSRVIRGCYFARGINTSDIHECGQHGWRVCSGRIGGVLVY